MRRACLAIALALAFTPAQAQNTSWPPPAGAIAFLGVYNSSAPTMTNGKAGWAQLDVNGNLKVNIIAGAGSGCVGTSGTPCIVDTNASGNLYGILNTINTSVNGSIPAGTNTIGSVLPNAATSTQTKVIITTGGTYQQYLASSATRKGCTIQFITAAHTGYVFFGAAPGDTTTSWQLSPGQTLNCNTGPTVLTDAIQLTSSNNSDVFVVNSW